MSGGKSVGAGRGRGRDRLGSVPQIDHSNLFLPRTTHDARRKFSVSTRSGARGRIGVVTANALISKTSNTAWRAARQVDENGDETRRMDRPGEYSTYGSNCVTGVR